MDEVHGFRETMFADRLEEKLAISSALTTAEREVWVANIAALRAVPPARVSRAGSEEPQQVSRRRDGRRVPRDSLDGHALQPRIELKCQDLYGDISARNVGDKSDAQRALEARLRARMVEPTDVKTLPLAALPSPFPKEEPSVEEELVASQAQSRANTANAQATMSEITECTAAMTGIRWTMMADKMQERLATATDLTADRRAAWEADLAAVRRAGAGNVPMPEAADPANPYRFMTWLSSDDQAALGTEYASRMTTHMATCIGN